MGFRLDVTRSNLKDSEVLPVAGTLSLMNLQCGGVCPPVAGLRVQGDRERRLR